MCPRGWIYLHRDVVAAKEERAAVKRMKALPEMKPVLTYSLLLTKIPNH